MNTNTNPNSATARRLRFTLPYPPGNNHLYAVVRGRKILSRAGRQYKEDAAILVRRAIGAAEPLSGRLHVTMTIYRPRKAGDIDNLFKAPFDAVKGLAWGDDGQVRKLTAVLNDDKVDPRLEMMVEQMDAVPTAGPRPSRADAAAIVAADERGAL